MSQEKINLIEKVNDKLIKFISGSDLHIDCFYMTLSNEELEAYKTESYKVKDIYTFEKLSIILKNRSSVNKDPSQ